MTKTFSVPSDHVDEQIDKALSRRDRQRQKAEREIRRLMETQTSFAELPIGEAEEGRRRVTAKRSPVELCTDIVSVFDLPRNCHLLAMPVVVDVQHATESQQASPSRSQNDARVDPDANTVNCLASMTQCSHAPQQQAFLILTSHLCTQPPTNSLLKVMFGVGTCLMAMGVRA